MLIVLLWSWPGLLMLVVPQNGSRKQQAYWKCHMCSSIYQCPCVQVNVIIKQPEFDYSSFSRHEANIAQLAGSATCFLQEGICLAWLPCNCNSFPMYSRSLQNSSIMCHCAVFSYKRKLKCLLMYLSWQEYVGILNRCIMAMGNIFCHELPWSFLTYIQYSKHFIVI